MNRLRDTFQPVIHEAYTVQAARYADGKVAIRCLDSEHGMKGRASRLLNAVAQSARYSGRERAYICSPSQAAKFIKAFADGCDGNLGHDAKGRLGFTQVVAA